MDNQNTYGGAGYTRMTSVLILVLMDNQNTKNIVIGVACDLS